jgi:hypothetical protein
MRISQSFNDYANTTTTPLMNDEMIPFDPRAKNSDLPRFEQDTYTPHPRRVSRAALTPPEADVAIPRPSRLAEFEKRLLAKLMAWLEEAPVETTPKAPAEDATVKPTPCESASANLQASPSKTVSGGEKTETVQSVPENPPENPLWRFARTAANLTLNAAAGVGLSMLGAALFGPVGLAMGGVTLFGLIHSGNEWIK